jgi:cell division protein FtsX
MSLKKQLSRFFIGPERGALSRVEAPYWNGLRIATIGGLMAFVGAAIVALGAESFGKVVVVIGILAGVMGLGYHFVLMILWFTKGRTGRR